MKKVKVTLICDEYYVAESLFDFGTFVDNTDLEYNEIGDYTADHFVAGVEEIDC